MQGSYLTQHTINPIANSQKGLFRLKVDIRSTLLHGICQQGIDQTNHRVTIAFFIFLQAFEIKFAGFNFMQNAVDGKIKTVKLLNAADNFFLGSQDWGNFQITALLGTNLVECNNIEGISHGERQMVFSLVVGKWQNGMTSGQFLIDYFDGFCIKHSL